MFCLAESAYIKKDDKNVRQQSRVDIEKRKVTPPNSKKEKMKRTKQIN